MRRAAWIAALAALIAIGCNKERPAPERYALVPSFAMVDHHGQPVTRDDLLGKVSIADFIFTRCATVCPVITLRMRHVQDRTDPAIQLLSFSVDPDYDTPARLADYAVRAGADPARWRFVTGDAAEMVALVERGFRLPMEPAPPITAGGAPQMVHSEHFVLIDAEGVIRGHYDSSDRTRVAALLADAELLRAHPGR